MKLLDLTLYHVLKIELLVYSKSVLSTEDSNKSAHCKVSIFAVYYICRRYQCKGVFAVYWRLLLNPTTSVFSDSCTDSNKIKQILWDSVKHWSCCKLQKIMNPQSKKAIFKNCWFITWYEEWCVIREKKSTGIDHMILA